MVVEDLPCTCTKDQHMGLACDPPPGIVLHTQEMASCLHGTESPYISLHQILAKVPRLTKTKKQSIYKRTSARLRVQESGGTEQ